MYLFEIKGTVIFEGGQYAKLGEEWKQVKVWYPSECELEGQEHTIDLDDARCQDMPTA